MATSLADVSSPQFGAVTRRRLPLSSYAYLLSQMPGFNQQAATRIGNRLAQESLAEQARQFDINYGLRLDEQALLRDQMEAAKGQAAAGNMINLGGIGMQTAANWDKIKAGAGKSWEYATGLKDSALRGLGYDIPPRVSGPDLLAGRGAAFTAKPEFVAGEKSAGELLRGGGDSFATIPGLEGMSPTGYLNSGAAAETPLLPAGESAAAGSYLAGTVEPLTYTAPRLFAQSTPSLAAAGSSYLSPSAVSSATETAGAALIEPGKNILGLSGTPATAINTAPGSIGAQELAAQQAGSQVAQGVGLGTSLAAAGAGFLTNLGVGAAMRGLNVGGENERRDIPAVAGGAVSGAMIGAQIGAIGGPLGAAIGAGLGLASSWIFCFAAGTPIRMADGTDRSVEDLDLNDCTYLGGPVLGVGKVFADNIYEYQGVRVEGDHAVFAAGSWTRVKDAPGAQKIELPAPIVVYPVITREHLLVSGQTIFADLCETDQGMTATDSERLAALNAAGERNAMLREVEGALRSL